MCKKKGEEGISFNKKLLQNKGITLIALVITIIVLLILAGVTIAMLTGENGILNKANQASFETKIASVREAVLLRKNEKQVDENTIYEGIEYTEDNPFGPINIWGYDTVFGDGWYKLDKNAMNKLELGNIQGEYVVNYDKGYVISTEPHNEDGEKIYTTQEVSVKEFNAGGVHNYIIRSDGSLWATGYNAFGQLGTGDFDNRNKFTQCKISNVSKVYVGIYCTFAIKENGEIYTWGANEYGQLGINNTNNQNTPQKLSIDNVEEFYPGWNHNFLKKKDGTVWAAGYNSYGQLGSGDNISKSEFIKINISDVKQIALSSSHDTIILKNDGTLWGCGYNSNGGLGLGDSVSRNTFTKLNIEDVAQITSYNASVVRKNDGTVWATGTNGRGELGLGDTANRNGFEKINIDKVIDIKGMYANIYATKENREIFGWGKNIDYTLGLGNNVNILSPTMLPFLDVKEIIAGGQANTFFVKKDDTIWGVGDNKAGQLGTGDNKEYYAQPIEIKFIK